MKRPVHLAVVAALGIGAAATGASAATNPAAGRSLAQLSALKAHPLFAPTIANQWSTAGSRHTALQPPAPPCPESGKLPAPFSNCGLPEFPATGQPYAGNMAYWGGPVQVNPHVYLVFLGWGQRGAFKGACSTERFDDVVAGRNTAVTLPCDPDRAGRRMVDFVSQIGGTAWEGVSTQYYETATDRNGNTFEVHVANPASTLSGVWVDDTDRTSAKITYTDMAVEAQRAAAHFRVRDLTDANFVIVQPQNFSDPLAQSQGYCAFHDYTEPGLEAGIYNHVEPGLVYTNMPYVLNQGAGCGENLVNGGSAGKLDAFTIALGHEILESVTDPGAEDILPSGKVLGGWFDPFDANENGDKCAYVGSNPATIAGVNAGPSELGEPGQAADISGDRGGVFPVQSTWSNEALAGVGYCAGAGNDLPGGAGSL